MARRTVLACLVVVAAHVAMLVYLAVGGGVGEPHRVPVVVSAPAVVAETLADQANAMPGEPFDATWTGSDQAAREAVADGTVVAAVLVDLRETRDVVVVSAYADPALADAVTDRLRSVEDSRERTFELVAVPAAADGSDAADRVRLFVVLCGLAGFGAVVVVSLLRGPVAPSLARGLVRVGVLAATAVATGALLQALPGTRLPGDDVALVAVAAGYILAIGLLTLAVEALAGLAGLAVAAAAYFVLATPLLSGTSPYLLPPPWPQLSPWTPTGAAQQALTALAYFDADRALRPALVVVTAGFVALVLLLLARALGSPERDRAGTAVTVRHWRLRVLAVVLPLAALMGLAITVVPQEVVAAPRLPSLTTETACVDDRRPRDVDDINAMIERLQGGPALRGADVGADVRLQDGRFLFVFGDTLRGDDFDGPRFVRNSMLLFDHRCVATVLPEGNGAVVPDRVDGVGYWPMSVGVATRPGYDLVLVGLQRVRTTGAGSFDFDNLGSSFAVFVVEPGGTPQYLGREDVGPDQPDKSRPAWGAAMATDGEWLYLYGTANPEQDLVFGFSLHVARVRPDDILDISKWEYWGGSGWKRNAAGSVALIPAEGGVSQTLSVFRRGDTWYALSKRDGDLGNELVFWTAPAPTGPFTPTDPVAQTPVASDGSVTYMPLAHPEIFPAEDSIVVSYSRNNTDFDRVLADPSLYRPHFLRLPLPQ